MPCHAMPPVGWVPQAAPCCEREADKVSRTRPLAPCDPPLTAPSSPAPPPLSAHLVKHHSVPLDGPQRREASLPLSGEVPAQEEWGEHQHGYAAVLRS